MKSKNPEKPFYGYVALASTLIISGILLITGFLTILYFSFLIGTIVVLMGIYAIFSYVSTMLFVNPTKYLDQSDILKLKGDELVLDVGCGLGRATVGVAKQLKNGKVVGVDIWDKLEIPGNSEERAYKNAEIEGVKDRVEFKYGDTFKLPFENEQFDVVICSGLLTSFHNDTDKLKAMKELNRVLKKKHVFLMREPVLHLKTIFFLTPTVFLLKIPSKNHWKELLEKSGFIKIKYYPHRIASSFYMIKSN